MTTLAIPYTVELSMNHNGRHAGWQEFGPIPSKAEAWAFIQSWGFTAADKGDKWIAYPASTEEF